MSLDAFELRLAGAASGRIELGEWQGPGAVIETTWGQIQVHPISDRSLMWRVASGTGKNLDIALKLYAYKNSAIELALFQGGKYGLKQRFAFHKKVWRHRADSEEIEVTVNWEGWFYNEDTLRWTIRFRGLGEDFQNDVAPALSAFICYWKAFIRRAKEGKGRLSSVMTYDRIF